MNIKEWNKSQRYQRDLILINTNLTSKFIKSIWEQCDECQHDIICEHQRLTPEFIKSIWKECAGEIGNIICLHQQLTIDFIKSIWEKCTDRQRSYICYYQHLTPKFIKSIWGQCDICQRNYIYESQPSMIHKHKNYPNKVKRIQRAKDYAVKHNLKVKGNYLYAFRNHTNGKGMYSKINTYKPGILYQDWHCDPRPEEANSFGFGVWPTGNTPIVVPLDKFVVEVDGGKARVEAFKVIK